MKTQITLPGLRKATLGLSLAVLGTLLLPGNSSADQIVNLSNGGSTAAVDLSSQAGMYNWTVLGQNQLDQQWFWYSINGGALQSIDSIASSPGGSLNYTQYGTLNTLDAIYANSQVSINVEYILTGSGANSGGADMTEDIAIDNVSGAAFNINFYQYSHFNLLDSGNNTVNISQDGNSGYNYVTQTSGTTAIQEAIDAPDANFAEAANIGQTLAELNNGSVPPYNLNDNLSAGAGDVTWAFEWTNNIAAGGEFDITKDKSLSIQMVPEPATAAFLGIGLGIFALARRRRSS
jgi:hypothetical protein